MKYFTEREFGVIPASSENIGLKVWHGLRVLIETRVENGSFGYRFPEQCPDGYGACGCDRDKFQTLLGAEIPNVNWPLDKFELPQTYDILEFLEFCGSAVGKVQEGNYHNFYRHHHLSWKREEGLVEFAEEVNRIFSRNAIAFHMNQFGQITRTLPKELGDLVRGVRLLSSDEETDRLLKFAVESIVSPKLDVRRDAIEKLWDAFERIKTLENGKDKKEKAQALVARIGNGKADFLSMLQNEFKTLTDIGNSFRIRHSESDQIILDSPGQVDYLFTRMFAVLRLALTPSVESS